MPTPPLRDGADHDSMDFLSYISAVSEAINADISEDDYAKLDTVPQTGRGVGNVQLPSWIGCCGR